MKKILIILTALLVYFPAQSFGAAGQGVTSWTAQTEAITGSDIVPITDVSDTTQSDDGSSKKATMTQVGAFMATLFEPIITSSTDLTANSLTLAAGESVTIPPAAAVPNSYTQYEASDNGEHWVKLQPDADLTEDKTIVTNRISQTIFQGTATLGTSAISDGACATAVDVTATGVVTTDVISIGYNGTPIGKTGYDPTDGAELSIRSYPASGHIYVLVCNRTGDSITPDAMTINLQVTR